ncbi:hypothetical protein TNCV_2745151 [Trichonephila clavipes]|nr:hypothetical protein TNCV_2745151 [Trichonephila clavipes]
MEASCSPFIPTPLAHVDNQGERLPRGSPLQDSRCSGLEVICSSRVPKLTGSIPAGVDRFSRYEIQRNDYAACKISLELPNDMMVNGEEFEK